jgi:hypothetical protein
VLRSPSPRVSSQAECHQRHHFARDLARLEQAQHRLPQQQGHHREHEQTVGQCRERLDAAQAVGVARTRRAQRDACRNRGQPERQCVGNHVPGVPQQCQRTRPPARQRLDRGEAEGQHQRQRQVATCSVVVMVGPMSMPAMSVFMAVRMGMVVIVVVSRVVRRCHALRPLLWMT